jgi:hypothetical protein
VNSRAGSRACWRASCSAGCRRVATRIRARVQGVASSPRPPDGGQRAGAASSPNG